MSDERPLCHLPSCDQPRDSLTLCAVHARILLHPLPVERVDPDYRREAA